eukprot:1400526-Ditylum_brightwellii.AAC.2
MEDSGDKSYLTGNQEVKGESGGKDMQEAEDNWEEAIKAEEERMEEERLAEETELEKAIRLEEEAWNQVDNQKTIKKKSTVLAQAADKTTMQCNKHTKKDTKQKTQSNTSNKKEIEGKKPVIYNKILKLDTSANNEQRSEKYMTVKEQMQKRGAEDIQKKTAIKKPVAIDFKIGED